MDGEAFNDTVGSPGIPVSSVRPSEYSIEPANAKCTTSRGKLIGTQAPCNAQVCPELLPARLAP